VLPEWPQSPEQYSTAHPLVQVDRLVAKVLVLFGVVVARGRERLGVVGGPRGSIGAAAQDEGEEERFEQHGSIVSRSTSPSSVA
jgi:hypothetical protein